MISDDGSTDNTVILVEQWSQKHPNIHLLLLPHKGKGWAVKNGMLKSNGIYRLMFDADMSMDPCQIENFLIRIQQNCDVVIGSRNLKESVKQDEPLLRKLMGRLFNLFGEYLVCLNYQIEKLDLK